MDTDAPANLPSNEDVSPAASLSGILSAIAKRKSLIRYAAGQSLDMWPLLSGEVAKSPRVETVIAMEGQGMAPYNDPTGRFNANNASILLRATLNLAFLPSDDVF